MNNENDRIMPYSLSENTTHFILLLCFYTLISVLSPVDNISHAETNKYPIKLPTITKSQSHYNTPENTFSAKISALLSHDLEWFYATLTKESAERNRKAYADYNLDPNLMFQMVSPEDRFFILDKFSYNDGLAMLVQVVSPDGSILIDPVIFVQENGRWKQTSAYNSDEKLADITTVVMSNSILSADIKMLPSHWKSKSNFSENNQHSSNLKNKPNGNTILCIIKTIRDQTGNIYNLTDVDPTKLKLNYQLSPLSVKHGKHVMGHKDEGWFLPEEHALLEVWVAENKNNSVLQKQYLAVRFDLKDALETLGELQQGGKYLITITGILGDNIHFRGESTITIAPEQKR